MTPAAIRKRVRQIAQEYALSEDEVRERAVEHGLAGLASTLDNRRELQRALSFGEPDDIAEVRREIIEDCRAEMAAKARKRKAA